jgi:regulator of RNase E activity RraA
MMKLSAQESSIVRWNTFTQASTINVPVPFTSKNQKVLIITNPGDLILGDTDGVVVIPPTLVEEFLKLCGDRSEVDKKTR